jgi:hypothetical protein
VARGVVVAGVEQGDPGVERLPDRGDRLGLVGRPIEVGHAHAAKAKRGDGEAGRTEGACGHRVLLDRVFGRLYPTD